MNCTAQVDKKTLGRTASVMLRDGPGEDMAEMIASLEQESGTYHPLSQRSQRSHFHDVCQYVFFTHFSIHPINTSYSQYLSIHLMTIGMLGDSENASLSQSLEDTNDDLSLDTSVSHDSMTLGSQGNHNVHFYSPCSHMTVLLPRYCVSLITSDISSYHHIRWI